MNPSSEHAFGFKCLDTVYYTGMNIHSLDYVIDDYPRLQENSIPCLQIYYIETGSCTDAYDGYENRESNFYWCTQ